MSKATKGVSCSRPGNEQLRAGNLQWCGGVWARLKNAGRGSKWQGVAARLASLLAPLDLERPGVSEPH